MINIYITHLSVFLLKFHLYNTVFKRERKKERKKEECYISFLNKIYLNIRIFKAELPFFLNTPQYQYSVTVLVLFVGPHLNQPQGSIVEWIQYKWMFDSLKQPLTPPWDEDHAEMKASYPEKTFPSLWHRTRPATESVASLWVCERHQVLYYLFKLEEIEIFYFLSQFL